MDSGRARSTQLAALSAIVCGLVILISAFGTMADPFLPLWPGNTWVYDGSPGEHESQVVAGTVLLWETEVFVVRYEESTNNEGLENYWTSEPTGDVQIWGWFRQFDNFGLLYYPPLDMVDEPLYFGKTWSCTTDFFTLPDTTYDVTVVFDFEVSEEGNVTVPAGTFYAFRLGYIAWPATPIFTGMVSALSGEALTPSGQINPAGWWCQGVGKVQYEQASDIYKLTEYSLAVSTAATSWGRIKSMYR